MKTLSLIVPTYNVEKYIGKCLESLSTDDSLEVLIIIDGSKDNSCNIAKEFQQRYPQVFKVIEKENGHYGSCVNVGLSNARGKYIKVLDPDDYFGPHFKDYLDFLKTVDVDVVLTNAAIVDECDTITHKITFSLNSKEVSDLKSLLNSDISLIHHYELTYRTELLRSIKYSQTQGISYTDLEWSSKPFGFAKSIVYYPETIYYYLEGRLGATVSAEYRSKNMWMENKVVLGLVNYYMEMKETIPSDNAKLLCRFISSMVSHVYYHYMVKYPGRLHNEQELLAFDKDLFKASEEIYSIVSSTYDQRKFGTFYYVNDFRKNKTRKSLKYFYYDSCLLINALVRKLLKK